MGTRKQIVMTAPSKLFVERYLTNKGKFLMKLAKTRKEKDILWDKYGKNRYRINPDAKMCRNDIGGIKIITHSL
jgi:hypothetical protein